jgi:hypothetical protein
MIFQNCNPDNLNSFNKMRLSKNKKIGSGSSSLFSKPSLKDESKQEWYPIYIKENATNDELVNSLEILIFLFFGMGNMQ